MLVVKKVNGVEVEDIKAEGLLALLQKPVLLLCANYFYTGTLIGVNDDCVLLKDPSLVYETGKWNTPGYTTVEKLHTDQLYVQKAAIEAFCVSK